MFLLINFLGVLIFAVLIFTLSRWIKGFCRKKVDFITTGLFGSAYLGLFVIAFGAIEGLLVIAVPPAIQPRMQILLIPIGKAVLYGSSTGLIFFTFIGIVRDVGADIKERLKKFKER